VLNRKIVAFVGALLALSLILGLGANMLFPIQYTVDFFGGEFAPSPEASIEVGKPAFIIFVLRPTVELHNVTIKVFPPGDLVRVILDNSSLHTEIIPAGSSIQIRFQVISDKAVDAFVGVNVTGLWEDHHLERSYYLHVIVK
jgi:hypothetical protein